MSKETSSGLAMNVCEMNIATNHHHVFLDMAVTYFFGF